MVLAMANEIDSLRATLAAREKECERLLIDLQDARLEVAANSSHLAAREQECVDLKLSALVKKDLEEENMRLIHQLTALKQDKERLEKALKSESSKTCAGIGLLSVLSPIDWDFVFSAPMNGHKNAERIYAAMHNYRTALNGATPPAPGPVEPAAQQSQQRQQEEKP